MDTFPAPEVISINYSKAFDIIQKLLIDIESLYCFLMKKSCLQQQLEDTPQIGYYSAEYSNMKYEGHLGAAIEENVGEGRELQVVDFIKVRSNIIGKANEIKTLSEHDLKRICWVIKEIGPNLIRELKPFIDQLKRVEIVTICNEGRDVVTSEGKEVTPEDVIAQLCSIFDGESGNLNEHQLTITGDINS